MIEHSVSKLGDKDGEHWAINAQVVANNVEKGDLNIYNSKNIGKMEEILAARSQQGQQCIVTPRVVHAKPPGPKSVKSSLEVNSGDNCSLKDTSSTASDSGGTFSSGPVENRPGRQNEKSTKGAPSSPKFSTREPFLLHIHRFLFQKFPKFRCPEKEI